jgi:hypothetical protein
MPPASLAVDLYHDFNGLCHVNITTYTSQLLYNSEETTPNSTATIEDLTDLGGTFVDERAPISSPDVVTLDGTAYLDKEVRIAHSVFSKSSWDNLHFTTVTFDVYFDVTGARVGKMLLIVNYVCDGIEYTVPKRVITFTAGWGRSGSSSAYVSGSYVWIHPPSLPPPPETPPPP